ncbi:MAG: siderophore-interacting protein [Ancrocorticia sp.]
MPRSIREIQAHPLTLRELTVSRVEDLTPAMRRVYLRGEQLWRFRNEEGLELPEFRSSGFDDPIRLYFPYPGEQEPVLPEQQFGMVKFPRDPRPIAKEYTVRGYDAEKGELAVDFVKHGVGVATTWAYRAEPGDRMHILGPPASMALPSADWLLVAGDDTAIPAIARLLEELPEDARAQVFIEVAVAAHRLPLRKLPGVKVTWLPRGGRAAGTTDLLLDAVRSVEWWEGEAFAWIAGESSAVKHIRRHLVIERGLPKENIDFVGYWKHGDVVTLDEDPAVPDPEKNPEAFETFHELAEIAPPLAIRATANLGLGELIFHGVTDAEGLAKACGADERAIGKLLRYLVSIEILIETSPGRYALSNTGEFLTNEYVLDVLRRDGVTGAKELALLDLTEAVRTGSSVYQRVTGHSFQDARRDIGFETEVQDQAESLARLHASALAATSAMQGIDHLVLHADGAVSLADTLTAHHPDMQITVVALPAQAEYVKRELDARRLPAERRERISLLAQSPFEAAPHADAVLFVNRLAEHPDADAVHLLSRAAGNLNAAGRVLVIESTLDLTDAPDEHDFEHDLLNLALHGSGFRTDDELAQIFAAADLTVTETERFGWNVVLRVLRSA